MGRTIITKILIYIWFVLAVPIMLMGVVSRRAAWKAMKITSGVGLAIARIVGGIKYEVYGEIPKSGIVASKHMSMMETGILLQIFPNAFFVLKQELMRVPIYGWTLSRAGMIPINRKKANMGRMVEQAKKQMEQGQIMIIFPEGTRVAPGRGAVLKGGIIKVARASKQPITPVGLDTGLYWPKNGAFKPGTAKIYFGKQLSWDSDLETIGKAIQEKSV